MDQTFRKHKGGAPNSDRCKQKHQERLLMSQTLYEKELANHTREGRIGVFSKTVRAVTDDKIKHQLQGTL